MYQVRTCLRKFPQEKSFSYNSKPWPTRGHPTDTGITELASENRIMRVASNSGKDPNVIKHFYGFMQQSLSPHKLIWHSGTSHVAQKHFVSFRITTYNQSVKRCD